MSETWQVGCCYEAILSDGSVIAFRLVGNNPLLVESPPGSKTIVRLDSLFSIYREIKKIGCPDDKKRIKDGR